MRLLNPKISSSTLLQRCDSDFIEPAHDVTQIVDPVTSQSVTSRLENDSQFNNSTILRVFVNRNKASGDSSGQAGVSNKTEAMSDNEDTPEEPLQKETVRGFSAKWLPSALKEDEVFFVDSGRRRKTRLTQK